MLLRGLPEKKTGKKPKVSAAIQQGLDTREEVARSWMQRVHFTNAI